MAMAAFPHRIISEAATRITASLEFRSGDTPPSSVMSSRRFIQPLSFDHLVGEREQIVRDFDVQCPRGPQIDHELKFGRPQHWQVRRLLAFENPSGIAA